MDDTNQAPIVGLYRGLQLQVEERPYETLAIAAGIGFVIGGGLVSKLGAKLLASGIRVGLGSAVAPVLTSLLQEVTHTDERGPRARKSSQHASR